MELETLALMKVLISVLFNILRANYEIQNRCQTSKKEPYKEVLSNITEEIEIPHEML
jgi:hypothetical protein